MAILDLDEVTDAVSDAFDTIGDAGDLIGGILKTVAPLLGAIPGVGTALAVAIYVAGAAAAKDKITDAVIGTASAAVPPGIPRVCFDGALAITKDVAGGRSVASSTIAACRQAAASAGGAPAVEAFDAGVAVFEGGRIDERAIQQGRQFALTTGGQAAAASFDVGVAIAEGREAPQVLLEAARGYVGDMGGAGALTAFDTGIALGYGKTLQEAGFAGLHTFVRGNNGVEKILNFVEEVGRAKNLGVGLQKALESDLANDFLLALGGGVDAARIEATLKPYLDAIRSNLAILQVPAGELAKQWGVDEAIVREAQALLRQGDGSIDERMLAELKLHQLPMSLDFSERNAATHDAMAAKGRAIIAGGARWKGRLLSDICKASTFTISHDHFDGLTGQSQRRRQTYEVGEGWVRGFEVAIGLCEGSSVDDLVQRRVGAELVGAMADGFVAGQEVQFNRTNPFGVLIKQSADVDINALALAKPPGLKDSVSKSATTALRAHVEGNQSVKASSTSLKLNR